MIIQIGDRKSKVQIIGTDLAIQPNLHNLFIDYFKVAIPNFHFARNKGVKGDGFKRFYWANGLINTGFLPDLVTYAKKLGISDIQYDDQRINVPVKVNPDWDYKVNGHEMYDHQKKAIQAILNSKLDDGVDFRTGVVDYATNSGKSFVLIALYEVFNYEDAVIFVHSQEILKQLYELAVECYGEENVGIVGKYKRKERVVWKKFTIAMYKKALNCLTEGDPVALEYCNNVKVVAVDECHKAKGNQYQQLLAGFPCGSMFGFSGTPFDVPKITDKMIILGTFGPTIVKVSNRHMIDAGHSLEPHIYFLEGDQTRRYANWPLAQKGMRESPDRLKTIIKYCRDFHQERNILIVCLHNPKSHVELTYAALVQAGLPARMLHGTTKNREEIVQELTDGKIKIIVTNILQEGFNGIIDDLLYTRGGKSITAVKQYIGRILRKKGNAENPRVIFFEDKDSKYLSKHVKVIKELIKEETFKIYNGYPTTK